MMSKMLIRKRPVTLLRLLAIVALIIYVPTNDDMTAFIIAMVLLIVANKQPAWDQVINPLLVGIVTVGLIGLNIFRLVYTTDVWLMAYSVVIILVLIYGLLRLWFTSKYYGEVK